MQQTQLPAPENPRLKAALREIEEVMHRYDVAGVVIVQVPTHCQFYIKLDPSHSLAYLENKKVFKVREPIIPGPDDEAGQKEYQQKVANTLNMTVNLQIMCGNIMHTLGGATALIRRTFNLFPPAQPGLNGKQRPKK